MDAANSGKKMIIEICVSFDDSQISLYDQQKHVNF